MKIQIDALLCVVEQKIKTKEAELSKINQDISFYQDKITHLLHEIQGLEIPKIGNSLLFKELYGNKKACLQMIDYERGEIAKLKCKEKEKKTELQALFLEKEKIKYLQQKEFKKILALTKKVEQNRLDEIASLSYMRNWRMKK